MKPCKQCGYVPGATCGYAPLTKDEVSLLKFYGYELDTNVHGDEIARPHNRRAFNSARYELHRVQCLRPTAFERLRMGQDPLGES